MTTADSEQVPLTTYVVADFDNEESNELLKEALRSIVSLTTPSVSLSELSSPDADARLALSCLLHP